ncbi:hypothetical protein [Sphingomonas sp.]|jgi:hypothetical protein|uniref:hypothetical protein n=1 Tax=Sphingomonas sp. TaxID=28214 RepID=UPI0017AEFF66|nr:hypothetical protein [Sphingomonas sp.]MBA4763397.1 hypothetical protein [Sphingomonas sp.]
MSLLLISAALFVGGVQEEEARQPRDRTPIACPYRTLPRTIDRDALANLARSGFEPKNNAEKRTSQMVGERISACQVSNGWGERSRQAAYRYLTGRVLLSNARYQLRSHEVTTAQIEAAHAALRPEAQQAVARGSIAGTDMTVAWNALVAGGAKIDAVPADQRGAIAGLILQGLAGVSIMGEAEAAFRAR